jgi:hypothetical protein
VPCRSFSTVAVTKINVFLKSLATATVGAQGHHQCVSWVALFTKYYRGDKMKEIQTAYTRKQVICRHYNTSRKGPLKFDDFYLLIMP